MAWVNFRLYLAPDAMSSIDAMRIVCSDLLFSKLEEKGCKQNGHHRDAVMIIVFWVRVRTSKKHHVEKTAISFMKTIMADVGHNRRISPAAGHALCRRFIDGNAVSPQ
eukprot:scaffold443152_cov14-Prasinocladus_malaysianus.AAC.1